MSVWTEEVLTLRLLSTQSGGREAHKGHAGSKGRSQGLTEHGSCRRGTLAPSIHSLAHTGVIQVTAAATHAGTVWKVSPALESITT